VTNVEGMTLAVGFQNKPPSDNGRVTVSHVTAHPNFNGTDRSYDIALVRLSAPLEFSGQVRPVCLPPNTGEGYHVHSQCVVTGLAYTPLSGTFIRYQATDTRFSAKEGDRPEMIGKNRRSNYQPQIKPVKPAYQKNITFRQLLLYPRHTQINQSVITDKLLMLF